MYICNCNGFTDRQIRTTLRSGAKTVASVYRSLGSRPKCGKCIREVRSMLREHVSAGRE